MSIGSKIPYLFSLILVTLQWLSKRISTALVSLLVSDLLNHLNPVACFKMLLTCLPVFSQFPPLQPLRIQFCFPQRQTDENTNKKCFLRAGNYYQRSA